MHRFREYVGAVSFNLLLAGAAFAQPAFQANPQSSFPGGFGTPLFQNPNISQALGLTPPQLAQLNTANQWLQASFRRESGQLGRYSDPQRNARMQDLMRAYNAELMRAAAGIMTPPQFTRYQQLDLQHKGFDAFADVEVQQRLNLTEVQLQNLQALSQRNSQEIQALQQNGQSTPSEPWRRYETSRQQSLNQTNGILTETQRRTWIQMLGPPLNLRPDYNNRNR